MRPDPARVCTGMLRPYSMQELSHDLDVIVKSLARTSCKRNSSFCTYRPFFVENKADCRFLRTRLTLDTQLHFPIAPDSRLLIERGDLKSYGSTNIKR